MVTVVCATTIGVVCERRFDWASAFARLCLGTMLYVLIPVIAYANFAHLELTVSGGIGIGVAYVGLGLAGVCAWALGRRIGVGGPVLGAVVVSAIIANTGYLGFPMAVTFLGKAALPHAVAYDQMISGPIVFTAGFAVGAAFGEGDRSGIGSHLWAFLTRNPPLVGAVAGLLVPVAWAPESLLAVTRAMVTALLGVGFIVVGIHLASERREDRVPLFELPDRRVLVAVACRLLVNPALLAAVSLAGVAVPSAYLLQAAMPTGINSLLIGHAYRLDQRLIATTIVWSTFVVLVLGLLADAARQLS